MVRRRFAFALLLILTACSNFDNKTLDIGSYTIDVPTEWQSDVPKEQEDSLMGYIKGKNLNLNFDFSTMGYANHLADLDNASQNIKIDSSGEFYIRTVWPKVAGKGTTGVYMQSKKSSLNLQINGKDLPQKQQEQALAAFKTIKIKIKGTSEPLPFK